MPAVAGLCGAMSSRDFNVMLHGRNSDSEKRCVKDFILSIRQYPNEIGRIIGINTYITPIVTEQ
jgi:hypothetical protein